MVLTKEYAAPEALANEPSVLSDVWSLGIVIYEIATGEPLPRSAAGQFTQDGFVDLPAIKNVPLRHLLESCFQLMNRRPTIDQIADRIVPSMFGVKGRPVPISPVMDASVRSVSTERGRSVPGPSAPVDDSVARTLPDRTYREPSGSHEEDEFQRHLQRAVDGSAAEQNWVGDQFYFGSSGVAKDLGAAASWYQKSGRGGNMSGMYSIGLCYQNGWGVGKDLRSAAIWYKKSAEGGNPSAMYNLGLCYEGGLGIGVDLGAAANWFRRAAERGNIGGMCNLGLCYENGRGVEKDLTAAAAWYAKSAEAGNVDAMLYLAVALQNGWGIAKDVAAARRWIARANGAGGG